MDDGGFNFFQTGLIRKVLEATGTDHCNRLPTPTKVQSPLGTDANGSETKRYFTNSYDFVIGMMLYLTSNTRPDISFSVHQCAGFTHNTKASHKATVNRIFWYLQDTKDNDLVSNPSKKLVTNCYADAYFAELWGHENTQDPIFARSRTGFVVTFENCTLLWVSKLQIDIAPSTTHSDYAALYHSVRALLTLKILIKEVIDNLGIDSKKLKIFFKLHCL